VQVIDDCDLWRDRLVRDLQEAGALVLHVSPRGHPIKGHGELSVGSAKSLLHAGGPVRIIRDD
jgi:hypothetical protein